VSSSDLVLDIDCSDCVLTIKDSATELEGSYEI
jgi:hypothetical protein